MCGSVDGEPETACPGKRVNMNIDPSTTKYMIQARMEAEGIVSTANHVGKREVLARGGD